jgi:hypothetical protein
MIIAYYIPVVKSEWKRELKQHGCRREDYTEMHEGGKGCDSVNWILVAQAWVQWWDFVNFVMNVQVQ